jgi:hypothetical protein
LFFFFPAFFGAPNMIAQVAASSGEEPLAEWAEDTLTQC